MDKKKADHFRMLLLAEDSGVKKRLRHLEDANELGSLKDSLAELSMYDNHPADIGTETFERSKDLGLRDMCEDELAAICHALGKIEMGTYGKCEYCGREIEPRRLEALPAASRCYDCQQQDELGHVCYPFGGYPEDMPVDEEKMGDKVPFDVEDAWQEVANYGTSSDIAGNVDDIPNDSSEDDRGVVENVDSIPTWRDDNGVIYEDFKGPDEDARPGGTA
jgi:YteA family regulatory protein